MSLLRRRGRGRGPVLADRHFVIAVSRGQHSNTSSVRKWLVLLLALRTSLQPPGPRLCTALRLGTIPVSAVVNFSSTHRCQRDFVVSGFVRRRAYARTRHGTKGVVGDAGAPIRIQKARESTAHPFLRTMHRSVLVLDSRVSSSAFRHPLSRHLSVTASSK